MLTGNYRKDRHILKAITHLFNRVTVKQYLKFIDIKWSDEAMEDCECIPCFKGEDDESK